MLASYRGAVAIDDPEVCEKPLGSSMVFPRISSSSGSRSGCVVTDCSTVGESAALLMNPAVPEAFGTTANPALSARIQLLAYRPVA